MGAKSEALAKQFEAKTREAMATIEQLSAADWKKVTAAEQWSVGVTAHHLAGALEAVSNIVKAIVAGQPLGNFTGDMLDQMNAQHAKDYANCTKAETIELHRKGAATAAAVIRGLSAEQLAKSGTAAHHQGPARPHRRALRQHPEDGRPRNRAVSTGGLSKARLGRLHEVMAGHVERGRLPGIVTLVSRRGEVHVDAIGMKAAGGREPMGRDTIFRIASLSKPIVAAAAMILVEECRLRLDEPVDRWLPELADRRVLTGRSTSRCPRAGPSTY